jgi:hypothetical protein
VHGDRNVFHRAQLGAILHLPYAQSENDPCHQSTYHRPDVRRYCIEMEAKRRRVPRRLLSIDRSILSPSNMSIS